MKRLALLLVLLAAAPALGQMGGTAEQITSGDQTITGDWNFFGEVRVDDEEIVLYRSSLLNGCRQRNDADGALTCYRAGVQYGNISSDGTGAALLWGANDMPASLYNAYNDTGAAGAWPMLGLLGGLSVTATTGTTAYGIGYGWAYPFAAQVFEPTSGAVDYAPHWFVAEINQTGTASGGYTFLGGDVTETALLGPGNLVDLQVDTVSKFTVDRTGAITTGILDFSKLATGTDGELITWDGDGNPAAVAVGTATHVLTSNGEGVAPTFQAAGGGGAACDSAQIVRAAAQSITSGAITKIAFDTEVFDNGGIADVVTNDRIDVDDAGQYLIIASWVSGAVIDDGELIGVYIYIDGASVREHLVYSSATNRTVFASVTTEQDLAGTEYIEMHVFHNEGASQNTETPVPRRAELSVQRQDCGS